MIDKPLISIIMPAYNSEKYIKQSIESVIAQTYENWELIVVNDASTDQTIGVINKLAEKDKRIKVISNIENLGVSKTRNKAITIAQSDWIAFLDSDDLWDEGKLEKQIALIREYKNVALFYTGTAYVNMQGKEAEFVLHVPNKISYKELLKQNMISCSSVLIRKELVQKYKMPSDKLHEDYAVWLSVLKDDKCAYGIDEPLTIYRISTNSKSSNKLNAVKMQYRVYRYIGLNYVETMYYMLHYVIRNCKKYFNLYSQLS